jgi:hypothetical protein
MRRLSEGSRARSGRLPSSTVQGADTVVQPLTLGPPMTRTDEPCRPRSRGAVCRRQERCDAAGSGVAAGSPRRHRSVVDRWCRSGECTGVSGLLPQGPWAGEGSPIVWDRRRSRRRSSEPSTRANSSSALPTRRLRSSPRRTARSSRSSTRTRSPTCGAGRFAGFVGLRVPVAGSLSGMAMQRGELLRTDDTATDPRVDRGAILHLGVASAICVPEGTLLHAFIAEVG